jgi:hypothetical protein
MAAMPYASIMDDMKKIIWRLVRMISRHRALDAGQAGSGARSETSDHFELSAIEAVVDVTTTFGLTNNRTVVVTHDLYRIQYDREWPDYDATGVDRILGRVTCRWTGDGDIIRQHAIFMTMSDEGPGSVHADY